MLLSPRQPPVRTIFLLSCLSALVYIFFFNQRLTDLDFFTYSAPIDAANATLGFGAVLAVSHSASPRRSSLLQAANVTGIHITIPDQPAWTDEDVRVFQNGQEPPMGRGSVLAWLGHANALKWFLDSSLETALILEDDVDWDIHLRSSQIPLVASAVRSLLPSPTDSPEQYFGNTDEWDLLYLGHCGDYFGPASAKIGVKHPTPADLRKVPHTLFTDRSLPKRSDLHPYTASLLSALGVRERTRIVHKSKFPLCTFAYAVTRAGAARLLKEVAPPKRRENDNSHAYDVAVLHGCMDNEIRCWTVNPELFHHMPGESMIAGVEQSHGVILGRPPVDVAGDEVVRRRKESCNIGCGFWSKDFEFGSDMAKMEWLQEEVGMKGKCLKPGRY